jgi:hypothetical protein
MGYFEDILFVILRADLGLKYDKNTATMKMTRARTFIEKLGSFTLGDRYIGDLKIEGNSIFIGKDTNNLSQLIKEDIRVNIE